MISTWATSVSLARALTLMERASATGELIVSAREGRATIGMREGRVIGIVAPTTEAPRLGQLIRGLGVGAAAVERAAANRGRLIGEVLVESGVVPSFAVSHGLRVQLRARTRAIAQWRDVTMRFEAGAPVARVDPTGVGELLLGAMREGLVDTSRETIRHNIGQGPWVMTPLGGSLIRSAPLWPDEEAVCTVMRRPASLPMIEAACRSSERGMRFALALRWLEAVAPPPVPNLALLARKARDIRHARSAEELLEVPRGASPATARSAWRRLTASLHPDRFASGSPELARLSNEVALALNGAAKQLRLSHQG